MNNWLNRMHSNNFIAMLAAAVLVIVAVGGYVGIKAMQNAQRAAVCEAQGGTVYGHDNWLCAK